jgi:hypothetical protein
MDVLQRNLLRKIRFETFGNKETTEPLSPFKTRKMNRIYNDMMKASALDEAAPLFASRLLLRRYKAICAQPDYLGTPTLHLFKLIAEATRGLMNHGLRMPHLQHIGQALRNEGQLVDFVTLQQWLERLGMQRVASLIGDVMVSILCFDADEIPFIIYSRDSLADKVIEDILAVKTKRQVVKYFKAYPQEVASGFIMRLKHRIDEVEE